METVFLLDLFAGDPSLIERWELGDDGLEIVGHRLTSACHYWLGEFEAARRSGNEVHRLYDPERHWGLVALTVSRVVR